VVVQSGTYTRYNGSFGLVTERDEQDPDRYTVDIEVPGEENKVLSVKFRSASKQTPVPRAHFLFATSQQSGAVERAFAS